MRKRVDVKGESHVARLGVLAPGHTGVVDDDGWMTNLGPDSVGYYSFRRSDAPGALVRVSIAPSTLPASDDKADGTAGNSHVVKDIGCTSSTTTVMPLSYRNRTMDANALGAPRHQHNLPGPAVRIVDPIVPGLVR